MALPFAIGFTYPPVEFQHIVLLAVSISGAFLLLLVIGAFFIEIRIRDRRRDEFKPHSRLCTLLSNLLVFGMTGSFVYVACWSWIVTPSLTLTVRCFAVSAAACAVLMCIWALAGLCTMLYNCGKSRAMLRPGSALLELIEWVADWWDRSRGTSPRRTMEVPDARADGFASPTPLVQDAASSVSGFTGSSFKQPVVASVQEV